MKCSKVIRNISEYIDGTLDELELDRVRQHLQVCDRCAALVRTLQKTISLSQCLYRRCSCPKAVIRKVYCEIRVRYRK